MVIMIDMLFNYIVCIYLVSKIKIKEVFLVKILIEGGSLIS